MGVPKLTYKTGRSASNNDPNQIKTFRIGGENPVPKSRRRKRKNIVSEWEEVIIGYLGGIFVLLPLLLFFIYLFPKFFLGLGAVLILLYIFKKLS